MGRDSIVWLVAGPLTAISGLVFFRLLARAQRSYVRLVVVPDRTDRATPEAVVGMYEALHATALQRWWRRLVHGQGSIALEVHTLPGAGRLSTVLAVACPAALRARVEAARGTAYPNATFERFPVRVARAPAVVRLKKRRLFVTPIAVAGPRRPGEPPVDRVIGAMAATDRPCALQVALTRVPAAFELYSRWMYRNRDRKTSDA